MEHLFRRFHATPHLLIPLLIVLLPQSAFADTVYLRNGDRVSGKLVTFRDGLCIFNTQYGASIRIESTAIKGISTDEPYEVAFQGGDKVTGRLLVDDATHTALESKTLGKININVTEVISLTRDFTRVDDAGSPHGDKKSFGSATDEQPPLDFLTGSTVLLSPGKTELDLGLDYRQVRNSYSLMNVGYFQRSAYTARNFQIDATIRSGLYEGLEGWITLPVDYSYVEQVSTNQFVRDKDSWAVGDVSFGLQYQIARENDRNPAISATIGISAPTGEKRYRDVLNTWKDPLDNGSGHWSISPGLAFVRTTDPAIIFGGVNYRHSFARKIDGYDIQPGWGISGYFGVGFALNERLSLGTRFSYAYNSVMKVDGENVYGSDTDPMDLSFSASYRFADNWVAVPQLTFNLNPDAGAPAISLRLKKRFE